MKKIVSMFLVVLASSLSFGALAVTPRAAEEPSATVLSTSGSAPKVVAGKKSAKKGKAVAAKKAAKGKAKAKKNRVHR